MAWPLHPEEYGEIVKRSLVDAIERSETDYAADQFQWWSFPQFFSNTSLMSGGVSGQMGQEAQVVAVLCDDGMFVYCNGAFNYKLPCAQGMDCVRQMHFPTSREVNQGAEAA